VTGDRRLLLVMITESVLVIALVIAGVLVFIKQADQDTSLARQERVISCQQAYISKLAGILGQRADIGDENRAATLAYAAAVATTLPGSTARDRAYTVYAASVRNADAMLAAARVPGASRCLPGNG
jgi:hypothetical protein